MRVSVARFVIFQGSASTALAVSTWLLANSVRAGAPACPLTGACDAVLLSPLSRALTIPLPLIGVIVFAILSLISLVPAGRFSRLRVPLALGAGGVGLGLIIIQAAILHHWCPLCLIVDFSALFIGLTELSENGQPVCRDRKARWWLAGTTILAFVGPMVWGLSSPSLSIPPEIKARWTSGKVNVVEISDFQCFFCRQAQKTLRNELVYCPRKNSETYLVASGSIFS